MEISSSVSLIDIQTCGHPRMPSWLSFCGFHGLQSLLTNGERNFCFLCLYSISHRHSRLQPPGASEKHGVTKRLWDHQLQSCKSLLWFKRRLQSSSGVCVLSLKYKQPELLRLCLTVKCRHSLTLLYHGKQHTLQIQILKEGQGCISCSD